MAFTEIRNNLRTDFYASLGNKLYDIHAGTAGTSLRFLNIGDSILDNIPKHLYPTLRRTFGDAGAFGKNANGYVTINGSGSSGYTTVNGGFTFSPDGLYYTIGTGNTLAFSSGVGQSNKLTLFYVKESGAGTFKIQTAVNNGSFADEAGYTLIDADNGTTDIGVVTITKNVLANYLIRASGLSGTVKILGAMLENTSSVGFFSGYLGVGGISIDQINSTNTNILNGLIGTIAPDLVFVEWKENASNLRAHLSDFLSKLRTAHPAVNILFIGSTPVTSNAQNNNDQLEQNDVMRDFAIANKLMYWDGYSPVLDELYFQNTLAWHGDNVHPSDYSNKYRASILLRDLGILQSVYKQDESLFQRRFYNAFDRYDIRLRVGNDTNALLENSIEVDKVGQKHITIISPKASTNLDAFGDTASTVGTISHPTVTQTYGAMANIASASSANSIAERSCSTAKFTRGQNGDQGICGYLFRDRVAFPDASYGSGSTGIRFWCGMLLGSASTTVELQNDDAAVSNSANRSKVGFWFNTNVGHTNFYIAQAGGGSSTNLTDTGVPFEVQKVYDFWILQEPQTARIAWRIWNITDKKRYNGFIAATPQSTSFLRPATGLCTLDAVSRNIRVGVLKCESII